MPDHIHGIIYTNADFYYKILGDVDNNNVGNGRDPSLPICCCTQYVCCRTDIKRSSIINFSLNYLHL